ncbi:MAG: Fic family protein [Moraxellaceae bacterium]|jgi:Fic family protein|nr:Fic family protein [Moraxellaceae bacterium]
MSPYQPPLTLTPSILDCVAAISEQVGRLSALSQQLLTPQLRRGNRIRTIQASLAIENNTLSVEQVTAVLEGRRVLGLPREIQEVRNAFAAYEQLPQWQPARCEDLLAAHGLLMAGLVDEPGRFRSGGVGIYRGAQLIHMAPPPARVPALVQDLLDWLGRGELHPLVASCVFHYEFEFIHPFSDGNGRMGRLWQTLILSRWQGLLAWLPVETVIRDRQEAYYAALAEADRQAEATPFVEFMLQALQAAMAEAATDQVSDQVSDQVKRLLGVLGNESLPAGELMNRLGLRHRPTFRSNYLAPALEAGWVEMTDPASPRSPVQRYRLTPSGRVVCGG